ncbi:hypothetical protein C0993_008303 [Termitomyces sp. T159_Od127]|nr:hypothetical protein C0993_008303 [Termitomyces sp. T159_Od127]
MSMSGQYLNTITENASRLGMRLQESFSEHTRDLNISRATGSNYLEGDEKVKDIRRQLDSNSDREKLDAMKRLVALISKGRNVSEYFAQVVKNVASHNLEIRKLVYIYLLRYAEHEPDLALLSINTFQKDLTDSNPLIRAMALRVLSGIKVPMIGSLVVLAIKKCAADISPYVRKNAALAIPKCFELDNSEVDKDIELLLNAVEPLFQSRNPAVVLAVTRIFFYASPPSYLSKIVNPLLRLLSSSTEVERVVLVYINAIARSAPHLFSPFFARFLVRSDDLLQVKREKIKLLLTILTVDNHPTILRELVVCMHVFILALRHLIRCQDYADDPDDLVVSDSIQGIGRCARLIPESTQQCLNSLIVMIKSNQDVVISSAVLVLKHLVQLQLSTHSELPGTSQASLKIIAQLARKIDDIRHAQARACVIWLVGQYAPSGDKGPGPEGVADWAPDVLRKMAKTFAQETPLVKTQIITLAAKLFVLSPNDRILTLLSQYVFNLARYDANYDVRDRARMVSSLLAGVISASSINGIERERSGVVLRREQVKLVLFEGKSGIMEDNFSHAGDDASLIGTLSMVTGKSMRLDGMLPDWLENGVESSLRDADEPEPLPIPVALSSAQQHAQMRTKGVLPIVLTPTASSSPVGSQPNNESSSKGLFKDLDKFYEDTESADEEEEDGEEDGEEDEEEEEEEEDSQEDDDDDDDSEVEEKEGNTRRPSREVKNHLTNVSSSAADRTTLS